MWMSFFSYTNYMNPRTAYGRLITNKVCLTAQGILSLHGKQKKAMLQGVHELYELDETPEVWTDAEPRNNRLVFIGKKSTFSCLCTKYFCNKPNQGPHFKFKLEKTTLK